MDGHQVVFAGNVGANVVLRETSQGVSVAEFSIAQEVNPSDRNSNKVSWWKVECWGPLANKIAQSSYCKTEEEDAIPGGIKGARVIVCGRVDLRHYTDDAGNSRENPTIVADEIGFSTHFGAIDAIRLPLTQPTTTPAPQSAGKGYDPEEPL